MTSSDSSPVARSPLLGLGVVVILPALLLAGFGLFSLRRDQVIALHDARQAARAQASRLAVSIDEALRDGTLPNRRAVEEFENAPSPPESEPVARLASDSPGTLGLVVLPQGPWPDVQETPSLPPPLNLDRLPPESASVWRGAEESELARPSSAIEAWERSVAASSGTEWEQAARFRLGRALLRSGRTGEALPLFEAVAAAPQRLAGETGVPLDILALRALLQLAEVDSATAERRIGWLDALCQRVLLKWRLPETLVEEWEFSNPDRGERWRKIARLHDEVRTQFRPLIAAQTNLADIVSSFRWIVTGEAAPRLLTVQRGDDATWLLLRQVATVERIVRDTLKTQGLPEYATASVKVAGRPVVPPGADGNALATVVGETVEVQIDLARPEVLFARQRLRTRIFGALIALAAIVVVAGSFAALRAYERQRQFAEMQGAFVASVTHELRAPLAAVRLMTEELVDLPDDLDARRAEYHRLILHETRRLGLLIENVLHHSRLERGRRPVDCEPVDVVGVVHAAVEGMRPFAIDRELRLDTRLPERSVVIAGDAQALQQVLVNLLDNAIKHSPTGSRVTVGLESASPSRLDGESPNRIRVWVADEGDGIPQSEHARIFESFYRRGSELRRETPGVGLGLAIVKRLVEAHGGTVVVSSQSGAGARFTVELPVTSLPDCPTRPQR